MTFSHIDARCAFAPARLRRSALAVAVAGMMASAAAMAADAAPAADPAATDEAVKLDTVIVRSSALRRSVDELVNPVEVLSGEELERRRNGTIGEVLATTPGVANSSFGPGVGRPVIRGQGGPRVKILDNGIGSMDASSVSGDHAVTVDPLAAEQIEVIKGPATLVYGGGASAGVVNVADDRLPDRIAEGVLAKTDVSYGDNADQTAAALRLRYGSGQWQFGSNYSYRDAEDYSIPGEAEVHGEDEEDHDEDHEDHEEASGVLENSRYRTQAYGASAAWVGEGALAGVAVSQYLANYGIPGHEHAHEEEAGGDEAEAEEGGVHIELEQTRIDVRGALLQPFSGVGRIELRSGYNDYQHQEIEGDGAVGTTFNVTESESRIELEHARFGNWVGVGGLQLSQRDFEAIGEEAFVPATTTDALGAFVVEGYELGEHLIEVGLRGDWTQDRPDDSALPDRSFAAYSLSAGVNLALMEHLHLRINGQSAQRAPSSEELYAYGPHAATSAWERGDLELQPETANNIDLSLGRDAGRWTWELSTYYSLITDYMYLAEVDQGLNADGSGTSTVDGLADRVDEEGVFDVEGELLLLDLDQQDAEFWGAEAQTHLQLVDGEGLRAAVGGFADIVKARLKDSGDPLPRVTPPRVGLNGELGYGGFDANLSWTFVLDQNDPSALETATEGYQDVAAQLQWTQPYHQSAITFYLRGSNLLDEERREATSYVKDIAPLAGRTLYAGLRLSFDSAL